LNDNVLVRIDKANVGKVGSVISETRAVGVKLVTRLALLHKVLVVVHKAASNVIHYDFRREFRAIVFEDDDVCDTNGLVVFEPFEEIQVVLGYQTQCKSGSR